MTALGIAHTRPDADPTLPDLADVLDLATVGGVPVEHATGLVVDGCAYNVRVIQEWASCGCQDGLHAFTKDNPFYGRSYWHQTLRDAETHRDERMQHWPAGRVAPHIVTQLVATSSVEEVKAR